MSSRDAIDARVREFVADLEKLVRAAVLEVVQQAIDSQGGSAEASKARAKPAPKSSTKGGAPTAASATPVAPVGAKRAKGQKRSPAELKALEAKLDAWVSANPGRRIEEIGKALSIPTSDLSRPMKKLINAGKVRTTGSRRATRYFPAKKK
ncbi:MAG: hypothetical protein OHK0013_41440 [Sandaracinaceae bacterium]